MYWGWIWKLSLDFCGNPAVKTLHFHCRGTGSIPLWGTKIPKATWHEVKWKSLSWIRLFTTPWTIQSMEFSARILEWVAFPFSRGSSQSRDWTRVSCIAGGFFTSWATSEAQEHWSKRLSLLQEIFPTQESNQGLLHCRQFLYQLSFQGSQPENKWINIFFLKRRKIVSNSPWYQWHCEVSGDCHHSCSQKGCHPPPQCMTELITAFSLRNSPHWTFQDPTLFWLCCHFLLTLLSVPQAFRLQCTTTPFAYPEPPLTQSPAADFSLSHRTGSSFSSPVHPTFRTCPASDLHGCSSPLPWLS